MKRRKSLNTVQ